METKLESGYASAASSTASLPDITLTKSHLAHLNRQLEKMTPQDILRFSKAFFPNLYQTTAFGLTGLVTLDMLSKLDISSSSSDAKDTLHSSDVDVMFLDTLYHFDETLDLLSRCKARYPSINFHVYRPDGCDTVADFESKHGEKLYETNAELYDWLAKVEPMQRAYSELGVSAVLTGRRRSQGAARDSISIVEMDIERNIIKINPLVNWSFVEVNKYVEENDVPYNTLLDQGYKSVGDWHSTSPVKEGEDERAGRWKGQEKTECGIHNQKSRYAVFLAEMEKREKEDMLAKALEGVGEGRRVEVEGRRVEVEGTA